MANNINVTQGTGTSVATDEISSVHYQLVKLVNGTEDATDRIGGDATNGLDVDVTRLPTVAHDSPDSLQPLKIGKKAKSSLNGITLVSADDVTDEYADIDGVQVVKNNCPFGDILQERVTNTDGISTTLTTFGASANLRNYITTIVVCNTNASTSGYVDLRDGTGGSVLMTIPLPANGGAVINLPVPLRQPTVNTALAYDVSAAISTIILSFVGFKSKG